MLSIIASFSSVMDKHLHDKENTSMPTLKFAQLNAVISLSI